MQIMLLLLIHVGNVAQHTQRAKSARYVHSVQKVDPAIHCPARQSAVLQFLRSQKNIARPASKLA